MSRKEQLERKIRDLYTELHAINHAEDDVRNTALIGKCFRTRNNYSCPASDDDRWWLYLRVLGTKEGSLIVIKFQDDKQGRLSVEMCDCYPAMNVDRSYDEISADDFLDAWKSFTYKLVHAQVTP